MSETAQLPAPLTPADCDLTDFEFMPVMTRRLLKSETWALGSGDERAAAVALWFESWHQVPAASLPSDDRLLRRLADTERWPKVKEQALRGWVPCSDGRLYHPVVAEKALEAWIEKLLNTISGAVGNAKRWQVAIDTTTDLTRLRHAVGLLAQLAPKAKALRKPAVLKLLHPSPPDSRPDSGDDSPRDSRPESPPDTDPTSPPDRKGQGQGQGLRTTSSSSARTPTCPIDEVIAAYHDALPDLPRVKLKTADRLRAIRKTWTWLFENPKPSDGKPRATTPQEAIDWLRGYFAKASENDFLMGRTPRSGEHANWKCDLDFLLTSRGMRHVIEKT